MVAEEEEEKEERKLEEDEEEQETVSSCRNIEELYDTLLKDIRNQGVEDLEDPNTSGWDKIHAVRCLLALEGYGPDKLAEGWRKSHGNFHRF